jgi:hypothetical protein
MLLNCHKCNKLIIRIVQVSKLIFNIVYRMSLSKCLNFNFLDHPNLLDILDHPNLLDILDHPNLLDIFIQVLFCTNIF